MAPSSSKKTRSSAALQIDSASPTEKDNDPRPAVSSETPAASATPTQKVNPTNSTDCTDDVPSAQPDQPEVTSPPVSVANALPSDITDPVAQLAQTIRTKDNYLLRTGIGRNVRFLPLGGRNGDIAVTAESIDSDDPQLFVVQFIAKVSTRDHFLSKNGNWFAESLFKNQKIENCAQKMTFIAPDGDHRVAIIKSTDWKNLDGCIAEIHRAYRTAPHNARVNERDPVSNDNHGLVGTNRMFEPKDTAEKEEGDSDDCQFDAIHDKNQRLMQELSNLDNYPAAPDFLEAARHLRESHEVQLIPAYDADGALIHPSLYESKLPGAIVHVQLSFIRHPIGNASSVLIAIIHRLDIIVQPKSYRRLLSSRRALKRKPDENARGASERASQKKRQD